LEEYRIVILRKRHIRWGKKKIAVLYKRIYGQTISSWKVQKVIEKYQLYYHPKKAFKQRKKRAKARQRNKKCITELNLRNMPDFKKKAGYIICLDTITFHYNGLKRYLFTAVDKYGKAGYARMYTSKSSKNGEDFLLRLLFLLDNQLPKVGHDNGSEFEKHFRIACEKIGIEQYYSRVRTPTDNPNNERFNRIIEEEFIDLGNWSSDPDVFNARLTE
jgi:transposase InsO family protein